MDDPTLAAGRDAGRGFGSIAAARAVAHKEEAACDGNEDDIDLFCCQNPLRDWALAKSGLEGGGRLAPADGGSRYLKRLQRSLARSQW